MDFKTFLSSSMDSYLGEGKSSSLIFQADTYPAAFFAEFFAKMRRSTLTYESLDSEMLTLADITLKLETSFLGMTCIYWLRSLHDVETKKKQPLMHIVQHYKGPHRLIAYISDETVFAKNNIATVVQLPQEINTEIFIALASYFDMPIAAHNTHFKQMLSKHNKISLESACVLLHYAQVLPRNVEVFEKEWLAKIVPVEQSLFTLSQYFFAKQSQQFFQQWSCMSQNYAMPFWITFWAEQVWRAACFIEYQQKRQFVEAKKVSYRLPFSFIQRDWKKIKIAELKRAHAFLYGLDHYLKNYREERASLELFYAKFLSNQF